MKAQREICPEDVAKSKFYSYPAHKVLGVFNTPESLNQMLNELKNKGFHESEVEIICQAGQIDFSGEEEKLWGRIKHSFEHLSAEGGYLDDFKEELNKGNFLVIIACKDAEAKEVVCEILQLKGGQRIAYFGNWVCEGMPEAHEITFDTPPYGYRRELDTSFNEAMQRTRKALQQEGFGVLVDIDLMETFKEKLGVDFRKYVILGACNPTLAHGALQEDLDIGLLLPCNVVVYESNGKSVVAVINANKMLSVAENPKLEETAETVNEKLKRAIDSI